MINWNLAGRDDALVHEMQALRASATALAKVGKALDKYKVEEVEPAKDLQEFVQVVAPLEDDEDVAKEGGLSVQDLVRKSGFDFGDIIKKVDPDKVQFVREMMQRSNDLKANAITSSSHANYASLVLNLLPKVQHMLSFNVIPMDDICKAVLFFSTLTARQEFAPRSWAPVPNDPTGRLAMKWCTVYSLKSALVHFHRANGVPCVLDKNDREFADFWRGLKVTCVHVAKPKTPVMYEWLNRSFELWVCCCEEFKVYAREAALETRELQAAVDIGTFKKTSDVRWYSN